MSQIRAAGFVLFRREPGRHLYLTLRSARHGSVGVPKGKCEPGEEDLATALRETEEETGIPPADLEPVCWFRRVVRYPLHGVPKTVTYFGAATRKSEVRLSAEHESAAWLDLDATLAAIPHENLRAVVADAAAFFKDPILRRGLTPAGARALLEQHVGAGSPVAAHTALVAETARAMAAAWAGGPDLDFVEAAAWLHDIGRAVDHTRHPLEGFRLVVAEGHPGHAPPCISHYTKGRPHARCGPLSDELWGACDLSTFPPAERLIALADALATGDRRVTIDERYTDLRRRYGPSPFLDESLAISRALEREFAHLLGSLG